MTYLDPSEITSWHAHVYFGADTRDAAWTLREEMTVRFGTVALVGRFHERPVGPHPMWSFQLAFERSHLLDIVSWLTLNHGSLDVLVHPNTGNALRDHRDAAMWIGHSHALHLQSLM
jgi:DOPA 4,5-dioxygenase